MLARAGRARSRSTPVPATAGQRAGGAVPGRRRPRHRRHHRDRVAARSAAPATGSGSPPTARCATACSPRTRSDLRAPLRAGADDEELAELLAGEMWAQAGRPRHRRARLPAAGPADVGDRRLTRGMPPASRTHRRRAHVGSHRRRVRVDAHAFEAQCEGSPGPVGSASRRSTPGLLGMAIRPRWRGSATWAGRRARQTREPHVARQPDLAAAHDQQVAVGASGDVGQAAPAD